MSKLKSKEGDNYLWGYVDENDNWVIEPKFDNAWDFSDEEVGLIMNDYMFGYIKPNGEILIEPSFPDASKFFFGHAIVKEEDGKFGVIDTKGNWVINPQTDSCSINYIGDMDDDEIHDFVEDNKTFSLYSDSGNEDEFSFEDKNWVQKIQNWIDL